MPKVVEAFQIHQNVRNIHIYIIVVKYVKKSAEKSKYGEFNDREKYAKIREVSDQQARKIELRPSQICPEYG